MRSPEKQNQTCPPDNLAHLAGISDCAGDSSQVKQGGTYQRSGDFFFLVCQTPPGVNCYTMGTLDGIHQRFINRPKHPLKQQSQSKKSV